MGSLPAGSPTCSRGSGAWRGLRSSVPCVACTVVSVVLMDAGLWFDGPFHPFCDWGHRWRARVDRSVQRLRVGLSARRSSHWGNDRSGSGSQSAGVTEEERAAWFWAVSTHPVPHLAQRSSTMGPVSKRVSCGTSRALRIPSSRRWRSSGVVRSSVTAASVRAASGTRGQPRASERWRARVLLPAFSTPVMTTRRGVNRRTGIGRVR